MRVLGTPNRDNRPGIAREVGKLPHEVEGTVLVIFPERLIKAHGTFLNRPVLAGGRAGVAVADQSLAIGIDGDFPRNVDSAIVRVEEGIFLRNLEAGNGGARVDGRKVAIRAHDYVGNLAEDVAAATVAPEIIGHDAEALEQFKVEVGEAAGTSL